MTDEPKIWIPPQALPENVKRMAWYLFLEWWKTQAEKGGTLNEASKVYQHCVEVAKIINTLEHPELHESPEEDRGS